MKRAARRRRNRLRRALGWLAALLLAVALGLAVRAWGIQAVRVVGASMAPTLESGEIVLVTKFDYLFAPPSRGDVVLCALPGREGSYIKRVIGLPGETVQIAGDQTWIDGAPLAEPYAAAAAEDFAAALGPDEYLVLGDNRPDSYDSRKEEIGSLASADFRGRVRCVLWPLGRLFDGADLRK